MTTANKISSNSFKKMLAGNKGYLSAKISKELKSAGMSGLLYKNEISKDQAIKVIRHLQQEGEMPKMKNASEIWHQTATRQYEQDQQAIAEEKQNNIRIRMQMDLAEDSRSIERGINPYDPKSTIGKSIAQEIAEEQKKRDHASKKEIQKKQDHDDKKPTGRNRPGNFDPGQIKDIIID